MPISHPGIDDIDSSACAAAIQLESPQIHSSRKSSSTACPHQPPGVSHLRVQTDNC